MYSTTYSFITITIWTHLVITSVGSAARFIGDPIQVNAKFEVLSERKQQQFNKEIFSTPTSKKSTNNVDDYAVGGHHDSNTDVQKRPKPFLNSDGQIEFYGTSESQSKALLQVYSTRKTTPMPTKKWNYYQTTMKSGGVQHFIDKSTYKPYTTSRRQQQHTSKRPLNTKATTRLPLTELASNTHEQNGNSSLKVNYDDEDFYKPTFRPAVLIANISNLEALSQVTSTTSPPDSAATSSIDDKNNNISSFLNDLSTNTIINSALVFGLPLVTTIMSLMGAGPLVIASIAWIIPLAAILILPDRATSLP